MLNYLSKIERGAVAVLLAFNTIILFVTVAMRYVFNASPSWTEEVSRYVMIWIIYIGVSQSIEANSELKIDILTKFSKSMKTYKIATLFGTVISMLICLFIVVYGFKFAIQLKEMGQKPGSFDMSMALIYIIIPVSAILMIIKYIVRLWSFFQMSRFMPQLYEYPYNLLRNMRNIMRRDQ